MGRGMGTGRRMGRGRGRGRGTGRRRGRGMGRGRGTGRRRGRGMGRGMGRGTGMRPYLATTAVLGLYLRDLRSANRGARMDDEDEALMEDFGADPVTALSGPLMKRVLNDVALERQKQDGTEGFFRDYHDGTAGRLPMGPTISREREGAMEVVRREDAARKTGKLTWRHQLDTAHAVVVVEASEQTLRKKLVELAAVSVAWVEAIDRRKDEKRIEAKIHARLPLFERIRQWWKRRMRARRAF